MDQPPGVAATRTRLQYSAPLMIHLAVPRESVPGETRVALVPETVTRLVAAGYAVVVEQDAGAAASFSDDAYRTAGATIAPSFAAACEGADVVLKVQRAVAGRGRVPARGQRADRVPRDPSAIPS